MSAKKRVFDKDLGVELVLDDEDVQHSDESRNRKKGKFEASQSNQSSSNITNQTTYSRVEQNNRPETSNLDDDGDDIDSENYEDIDYGDDDDDDDQDFSNDHQGRKQGEESKSKDNTLTYDDSNLDDEDDDEDDDEHENLSDVSGPLHLSDEDGETKKGQKKVRRNQEKSSRADSELEQDKSDSERDKMDEGKEEEKIAQEKCKYWPSCNAGDECSYYHPTIPCRAFPNCRFGKKCLYIHPPCKFNPCTRPGCPFAHPANISSARRPAFHPEAAQQPLTPRCKYGYNCMNLMCKFSHQRSEPCRFGANCLLDTCPYTHPSDVARKKPANAFKWSAQS